MAKYNIFTDGACPNNGRDNARAGWAIIVCDECFNKLDSSQGKVMGKQTNNRAELFSILIAFKWIKDNTHNDDSVTIYSDSEICIKMMLGECKRIKNRDIWEEIETTCEDVANKISLSAQYVSAHADDSKDVIHALNNEVDKLAKNASRALF